MPHPLVVSITSRGVGLQAVPLPDAGELTRDPGPLPKAAAKTSVYFEVRPCSNVRVLSTGTRRRSVKH